MKTIATLAIAILLSAGAVADDSLPLYPQLEFKTSQGNIIVELDSHRAPVTVHNFVKYAQDKFYDGTIFHRVIENFVAQAGGFDKELNEKKPREPIPNESGNGLSNVRGTIAMARMGDPHSANAQFYFNLADNTSLDPNPSRWGYCVFGTVLEGMDILDKIAAIPTSAAGPFRKDYPETPIIIESVRLIEADQATSQ